MQRPGKAVEAERELQLAQHPVGLAARAEAGDARDALQLGQRAQVVAAERVVPPAERRERALMVGTEGAQLRAGVQEFPQANARFLLEAQTQSLVVGLIQHLRQFGTGVLRRCGAGLGGLLLVDLRLVELGTLVGVVELTLLVGRSLLGVGPVLLALVGRGVLERTGEDDVEHAETRSALSQGGIDVDGGGTVEVDVDGQATRCHVRLVTSLVGREELGQLGEELFFERHRCRSFPNRGFYLRIL